MFGMGQELQRSGAGGGVPNRCQYAERRGMNISNFEIGIVGENFGRT